MKIAIYRFLLVLGLVLPAQAVLAQTTHLNVPVQQVVTIQVNPDTSTTPATQFWSEWLFGAKTGTGSAVFVVPKGKTLVITDLDITVNCTATSTSTPLFSISILDPSGTPLHFLSRFKPTLLTVGREQLKSSFTSGVVIPEGYQLSVDNIQNGNHLVARGALLGYYVE